MIPTTFFLIVGSIFTSTALILCNKKVMTTYNFGCPTFLTSYHFVLSFILLHILGKLRFFEISSAVPTISAWYLGLFGVVSIVAMNFNLKLNSIGFYQLSKLCNIPCMVIYKYFFFNQKTPLNTLGSLGILLIGLCLFTVNDVQFNIIGSVVAALGVITTTVYQTQTQSYQKQYGISGTQLNYCIGVPQFTLGFLAASFIETHGTNNIFDHQYQTIEIVLILSTGLLALVGNVISFSLIGKAGPVTFQVVGHVKTMLIFIFGLIMFPATQESSAQFRKKILGLCISMVGVCLYTVFELKNKEVDRIQNLRKEENEVETLSLEKTPDSVFKQAL